MQQLPRLALSVRQPWAWAICHAGKDVENRDWRRPNPGLSFRGPFAVHAAKGMTRYEYMDAADTMRGIGVICPHPSELLRGGIVGVATVVDIVKDSDSPWFFGSRGLLLQDAAPVDFIAVDGALGFFEWKPSDRPGPDPAPLWMRNFGLTRPADPNWSFL